jgi:hypothetical protein
VAQSRAERHARLLKRVHGWLTVLWAAMIPVSMLTGLKNSLPYLVGLSVYALMVGHFSSWQAGRAEVSSESNPPQEAT